MCHYITATLPESADLHSLRQLARRYGRRLEPVENPHVEEQLPHGLRYLLTAARTCDCGTGLGSFRVRLDAERHERQAEELRQRGWSDDRVQQWVGRQQAAVLGVHPHLAAEAIPAKTVDTENWVAFIREALAQPGVTEFGLLLHWYAGTYGSERIDLQESERVSLAGLTPELLLKMEEDVLYRFIAPEPAA